MSQIVAIEPSPKVVRYGLFDSDTVCTLPFLRVVRNTYWPGDECCDVYEAELPFKLAFEPVMDVPLCVELPLL